jgi:hypothetical protein
MRLDGLGLRERRVVEYFERGGILWDFHEAEIGWGRFERAKTYGKVLEILWERHDVKQNAPTCDVC